MLLGLGGQFSRFAHAQLQAPPHHCTTAPLHHCALLCMLLHCALLCMLLHLLQAKAAFDREMAHYFGAVTPCASSSLAYYLVPTA